MKTTQRTRIAEVHFCEICGRRIAGVEMITTGTKLCSGCDKLTSIRRPGSRRSSRKRMVVYENHFWLVMGLVVLTLVLLVAAILMPSRKPQTASGDATPVPDVSSTSVIHARAELQPSSVAAVSLKTKAADNEVPPKRRNPEPPDSPPPAPTPPTTPVPATPAPKPAAAPAAHAEPSVTDLLNKSQAAKKPTTDDRGAPDVKPATAAKLAATAAPAIPALSTTPPTAESAASIAPKTAASAASAAPAANPAPAAEAPRAAEDFEPFDVTRKKAYARLVEGDCAGARQIFEPQRKNPAVAPAQIDDELALVDDVERVQQALPAGLKQLDSKKITSLILTTGRSITLGAKCTVTSSKDDVLEIEENCDGASITRKVPVSQLSALTRYEIVAQSLPENPANSLSLASAAYVYLRTGTAAIRLSEFKARLEGARKDATLAARADRLQEQFTAAQKEQAIEAAMKKINDAIKGKLPAIARNLLRDFKKDYASGDVPPHVQEFIDKTSFELAELKQGLWASFFCGEEENPMRKYLFSREETKLNFSWGQGSPDPKVPNDCFGIRFHGLLRVTTPGTYVLWASADDMLELTIDGKHVLATTWTADAEGGKTASVKLTTGDHDLKVTFKEIFVDAMLHVKWKLDSEKTFQEISPAALWYDPKLVERYQKDVN